MKKNTPQSVLSMLENGRNPMLAFEHDFFTRELTSLGVQQQDLGIQRKLAMEQSSETWHDNAPADAVNHQSHVVSDKAAKVIDILRTAEIVDYPDVDESAITIGSLVGLLYRGKSTEQHVVVTGINRAMPRLRPVDGPDRLSPLVVTARSPLGIAILGSEIGEAANYSVNNRHLQVEIASVHQLSASQIES